MPPPEAPVVDRGVLRARRVNAALDRLHAAAKALAFPEKPLRPRLVSWAASALSGAPLERVRQWGPTLFDAWRGERSAFVQSWTDLTLARPILSSTAGGFIGDAFKSALRQSGVLRGR